MAEHEPMSWYIGTELAMPLKGLRKQVISLNNFKQLDKPHLVSKLTIKVEEVQNLNGHQSRYLASEFNGQEQKVVMGMALTPTDCYVELLARQMIVGEQAICFIATKKGEIRFILTLLNIHDTKEIHKLNVAEIYALALRFKENGVVMFKQYPRFAHEYFARAAKCLISYKPFNTLSANTEGVSGDEMESLFTQIQTNLAACLLNEERYEDVIYVTKFVEEQMDASEKSIYRRATAFYHLKEFEKARRLIERVPNYQEKKDFAKLHHRLADSWKTSNEQYKNLVQRMFS
ncbi:protein Bride of doubletime [Eurosta solidaginis]|uniref:protein Bride of doubletime n=1 Tax=Eurosta solidaginis TaxID=178769 RepID=UPI0035315BE3